MCALDAGKSVACFASSISPRRAPCSAHPSHSKACSSHACCDLSQGSHHQRVAHRDQAEGDREVQRRLFLLLISNFENAILFLHTK